ncbi:MAG: transposase zinc-binding domain-containing protein, partial [Candidatus Binatales bacterium]
MTARPAFELAEVFRRHSEAYGRANAGHLGRIERRVIGAVAACRTAALGGHVEQCDDCGAVRIAYNSCLMGTSSNGELAHWRRRFSVNCSDPSLHNSAVLRLRRLGHPWPVTN